ncbi:hypothetical protein B0H99_10739 [Planomicrobium soli]|uniref:Uncharacterized protein n=1 Tax=Planomicrobium soli TaxID=1176648 RepID=A0A2P8GQH0_9BACL|nr:hypothetical protein [Planomicrobium soli]PSL36218.1 hypothetical protein B0H99_10739 [Planomicrobium soli]
MNFRFLFLALILIGLSLIMGCSEISDTSEKADNDSEIKEVSNLDASLKDAIPKPPSLTVFVGEKTIRPSLGTYSWSVDYGDGTASGIEADSFAPPELVKGSRSMQVTADTPIELVFGEQPESYIVRIWDNDNNVVNSSKEGVLSGKGKTVYEVLAHWEQGTASYVFSLDVE